MRCLVIGASGYVGSRLVEVLLDADRQVRALSRDPDRLRDAPFSGPVEVVRGDVVSGSGLSGAMQGIDVVYYLVHSLAERDFAIRDRDAAANVARAAADAGVSRIVYLGGLRAPTGEVPSEHLASRAEVGEILLSAPVPAVVLQAAVITGAGSASFEIIRHLTEQMPVTVAPGWFRNRTQPIAIADVLHYLVACAELPAEINRAFDIGGPDVLTYGEMTQRYARVAGLPRRIALPVAFLPIDASARWVGAMTPVARQLARPLLESLRHELVCTENDIDNHVKPPLGGLLDYETAIRRALHPATVEAGGQGAGLDPARSLPTDPLGSGAAVYQQRWEVHCGAGARELWQVVEGLGGTQGWHTVPGVFEIRGWVDQLLGGIGAHRGRRDPQRLQPGDTVDFWRVEDVEPGRRLVLRAEMKMPGTAWLTFTVLDRLGGGATLHQEIRFEPSGFSGRAYWWLQRPVHDAVFAVMARGIARAA